ADSPYRHPQKVYYALELLAEYAEARRRPENTRLPLDGWLKEQNCPFQFAPNESESTRNDGETEKQRTLQYAGLPLVLRKHLKIGKVGDANDCCRIYFEIMDSEAGKVLIGH